jgi:Flp pilus assembly protein TadD
VVAVVLVRQPAPAARPPAPTIVETPLQEVEKLIQSGDLTRAEAILQGEKQKADSMEIEEALATVAERRLGRGAELSALSHLERAARLKPKDPEPHARMAALLHRLGDKKEACQQARRALELDPQGSRSGAARTVVAQARCPSPKEAP